LVSKVLFLKAAKVLKKDGKQQGIAIERVFNKNA
jgi:hypothetical protein